MNIPHPPDTLYIITAAVIARNVNNQSPKKAIELLKQVFETAYKLGYRDSKQEQETTTVAN